MGGTNDIILDLIKGKLNITAGLRPSVSAGYVPNKSLQKGILKNQPVMLSDLHNVLVTIYTNP